MTADDTIYALSSGNPPAAIAIVRVSGSGAGRALEALGGEMPEPRRARLTALRSPENSELLDHALTLWFPGPASATGEDLVEFHLHGGRSVVAAVLVALAELEGLRLAAPGEFTRRAFENGRIDLTEAEGLADLLMAETQSQRRAALALAGGALSRAVDDWQHRLLGLAAEVEAALDFSDEGDVAEEVSAHWIERAGTLSADVRRVLERPAVERLRDGIRVVIAGPPNAGKSSLLNYLAGREAAITSAVAGTTRDLVEAPTAIGGAPFLLIDTAGLRDGDDEIETIGVQRARDSLQAADLMLWLGEPALCPDRSRAIIVQSKVDLPATEQDAAADIGVSVKSGEGLDRLVDMLIDRARHLLPADGEMAINARHREALAECVGYIEGAVAASDLLIRSEELRQARASLDRVTGRAGVEDMLDALFGNFCIGK